MPRGLDVVVRRDRRRGLRGRRLRRLRRHADVATANIAPTFVYVSFWVGLASLSVLFGDVFGAFNPWRAIARAVASGRRGAPAAAAREPLPYPAALGRWPAAPAIPCFAWLELVYVGRDDPGTLAIARARLRGGAARRDEPLRDRAVEPRGDAFGVYFGLFARISPLRCAAASALLPAPAAGRR